MSSKLIRAILRDGSAYVHVCNSTEIVAKAREIHQTSKTMTAALGRCLTACSLMGAQLKGKDNSLTFQIKGDGPAGTVLCVSDYNGNVKGFCDNPDAELPPNDKGKLDVGGVIGQGTMHIIKDLGMAEPYIGLCPLVNGEIAEDVTEYYVKSEQIPTACALGVRVNKDLTVKSAGGFLLQLLPGADDGVAEILEKNIANIDSVSAMIADGMSCEDIINKVFANLEYDILDETPVAYQCGCNREKYHDILATLNGKDMQSLIDEGENIETVCNFCRKKYIFTVDELKRIVEER